MARQTYWPGPLEDAGKDFEAPVFPYHDGDVRTGCAVEPDGKIYLFWTVKKRIRDRVCNSTCLAICEDEDKTFHQYHDNPVIKADSQWYYTEKWGLH